MSALVDLRSDTITRPTPGMRKAIAAAEVGDDVYGEDPTVTALEARVAGLLKKEAALYIPSGTMGNQLGLLVHTTRATEVIVERNCHIVNHEGAAGAWLSGVQLLPLRGNKGILYPADIKQNLRTGQYGAPSTSLICLENTHNLAGGRVQPLDVLREIRTLALDNNIPMHMDGARLWNAAAASGIPEHTFAACFDTATMCLSKGLGAPVGSVLVGSHEHIARARHYRSRLGGSMRQAGILAAAGLYALDHHRSRLSEDHARAKALATALNNTASFSVDPDDIESNIVFFHVANDAAVAAAAALKQHGILVSATAPDTIRAVTHLAFTDEALQTTQTVLETSFCTPITT
ncbi:MAG: GntG family PLP-dependent aldolase [Bacteroidota bacterium]